MRQNANCQNTQRRCSQNTTVATAIPRVQNALEIVFYSPTVAEKADFREANKLAAAAEGRTVLDLVANGLCIEVGVIEESSANN
jgi:hypothetical protein